jgi:hypothetical protein
MVIYCMSLGLAGSGQDSASGLLESCHDTDYILAYKRHTSYQGCSLMLPWATDGSAAVAQIQKVAAAGEEKPASCR